VPEWDGLFSAPGEYTGAQGLCGFRNEFQAGASFVPFRAQTPDINGHYRDGLSIPPRSTAPTGVDFEDEVWDVTVMVDFDFGVFPCKSHPNAP